MKRSQATLSSWVVVAGLCVAAAISLRTHGWRKKLHRAPAVASPPGTSSSTRETAPRFSRDPEHLQKLWTRLQAHQGLDPFAEPPPALSASSASPSPSNLVITAIWRQRGKSLAVINGRIVPEDSELSPYRITRIGPYEAELTGPGGPIRLALSFPSRGAPQTASAVTWTRNPPAGVPITSAPSRP